MKYEILEISRNDACCNSGLKGKIGFGHPKELPDKKGYYSGGLHLSFIRNIPIYSSIKNQTKGIVDYYKDVQSTEYVYFLSVKLIKVAN